ncbi:family 10 glycosylhydrolase [uncultured Sunxiuqinia sp.]|uniref:glycoside hydrolase family 10 protein n=1 Tax=uncultured Sunxiuqinia sp. TaxID=1573825 RepID=UPI002603FE28|nr:family 10 glycosylhydrolase [uncultured Sunxiuqinia sp.]
MKHYFLIGLFCMLGLMGCQTKTSWLDTSLEPAIYHEKGTKKLTSVNPENKDFPGGRGSHHLVAYTNAFGEKTGTNEWGSEAVIQHGRVMNIGGNNSDIPADGLVLSGNESASRWINQALNVGMEIELEGDVVHFATTENTFIYQARELYKKALQRAEAGKMTNTQAIDLFVKNGQADFEAFEKAKKEQDTDSALAHGKKLLESAKKLYYNSFEPRENEFRGVWVRLRDKTPDKLKATIKRMADAGINAILPETIYDGYAIYPNAHALLPQLPQFEGWDPMQVMMEECEKYNMQVIPWCEMFFVGGANSPLVKQKPEWVGKFRHGEIFAELEPGFHYFCPSRPEVADFLLKTVDTMLERYAIKEVQLDYIRYSLSEPWEKGFCYCDYCRKQVRNQLNFDIMAISPENKKEWEQWNDYRINNVTGFVNQVNDLLQTKHKEVKLSVDVVPNPIESTRLKFQNWGSWVKNDQVDAVYIMSYAIDNEVVRSETQSLMDIVEGTEVSSIVGLGPYLGFTPETLLEQIEVSREGGADGVCLFSFNGLSEQQLEALKNGPFRSL